MISSDNITLLRLVAKFIESTKDETINKDDIDCVELHNLNGDYADTVNRADPQYQQYEISIRYKTDLSDDQALKIVKAFASGLATDGTYREGTNMYRDGDYWEFDVDSLLIGITYKTEVKTNKNIITINIETKSEQ